jgi:hypothetical protein
MIALAVVGCNAVLGRFVDSESFEHLRFKDLQVLPPTRFDLPPKGGSHKIGGGTGGAKRKGGDA